MSAVDILIQATKQTCQEAGKLWPDGSEPKFEEPCIIRMAEVFAELVLAEHTTELEQESRLMRARMDRLQAERDGIVQAIVDRLESACGAMAMPPSLIRREFMPERKCVTHTQPDDTEGGAL